MSVKFPLPLPFLRTKEAARFIGVSCRTLEKYGIAGTGPKYSKIAGRIVYAVSDLTEWSNSAPSADPATVLPAKPINKRAAKSDGVCDDGPWSQACFQVPTRCRGIAAGPT